MACTSQQEASSRGQGLG